jgi:hypothetical protein
MIVDSLKTVACVLSAPERELDMESPPNRSNSRILPYSPTFNQAFACMKELYEPLPRLLRLIRLWKQVPTNDALGAEAVGAAKELYLHRCSFLIEEVIVHSNSAVPKLSPDADIEEPPTLEFDSVSEFILIVRYYCHRLLLYGAIHTICNILASESPFDIDILKTQDLHAARIVDMSVGFALQESGSLPLSAHHLMTPLKLAFGAWHRLEQMHPNDEDPQNQTARYMKELLFGLFFRIRATSMPLSSASQIPSWGMTTDTCAGGHWKIKNRTDQPGDVAVDFSQLNISSIPGNDTILGR